MRAKYKVPKRDTILLLPDRPTLRMTEGEASGRGGARGGGGGGTGAAVIHVQEDIKTLYIAFICMFS